MDMEKLSEDLGIIKTQIAEIKADIADMKPDVIDLKLFKTKVYAISGCISATISIVIKFLIGGHTGA